MAIFRWWLLLLAFAAWVASAATLLLARPQPGSALGAPAIDLALAAAAAVFLGVVLALHARTPLHGLSKLALTRLPLVALAAALTGWFVVEPRIERALPDVPMVMVVGDLPPNVRVLERSARMLAAAALGAAALAALALAVRAAAHEVEPS